MLVALAFSPAVHVESPLVHVRAQGPPPAEKVNITDYGEDNNDDLLYEFLVINFTLYIAKVGSYKVYGYLIHGNTSYSINSTTKTLGLGLQYLELRFNSIPIFNNTLDGQFRINYSLRFNNVIFMEDNYVTRSYNHRDFFAITNWPITQSKYIPTITKESQNERYVLKNNVMTVWFYYKVPRLVWFYTMDNKTQAKWYCEFLAVHGYVERGAGFDPSAAQYKGNLKAHGGITTSSMVSDRSRIFGEYVSISVTLTDVPINATSSGNPEKLADITLTVTLAAGDRSMGLGLNRFYTISGGTQLSVNVGIDLGSSLGINGLAIEQDMWSESVKKYPHDLRLTDQSNNVIEWESTDAKLLKYLPGGSEPQEIKFQPKNTVQPNVYDAYYYWISRARVDGTYGTGIMFYQYMPTEKRLKMFLAVETGSTSITNVQTDPLGVGLFEDGFPPVPIKKINPAEQPSFLITIMGWVTAVILVILPLYVDFKRAQKKLRELEEEFGEDL